VPGTGSGSWHLYDACLPARSCPCAFGAEYHPWSPSANIFVPTPNHSHVAIRPDINIGAICWRVIPVLVLKQSDGPTKDATSGLTSYQDILVAIKDGRAVQAPAELLPVLQFALQLRNVGANETCSNAPSSLGHSCNRSGPTYFSRACFISLETETGYCAPAAIAFPEDIAAFASLIPDWICASQSRCGIGDAAAVWYSASASCGRFSFFRQSRAALN
jgi:hypothetical protein